MKVLHKQLPYGKGLWLNVLNSRTLEVYTDAPVTNVEYTEDFNNKISKVVIGDDYEIKLHDTFKIPFEEYSITYEANNIIKVEENAQYSRFILTTHERNRTTTYLLPALLPLKVVGKNKIVNLATRKEMSKFCVNTYLINAYISKHNLNNLTLVYRFSNHSTYKIFEDSLLSHPGLIKVSEGKDNYSYVVFEVQLEKEFRKDVTVFLNGKYSELSNGLKTRILTFNGADKRSPLFGILMKTDDYRQRLSEHLNYPIPENMELDSKPDRSKEYWDE